MNIKPFGTKHSAALLAVIVLIISGVLVHHQRATVSGLSRKFIAGEVGALLGSGRAVFISPSLLPGTKDPSLPSQEESLRCIRKPALFHELHRARHFTAILLAPDDAGQPLCTALLASPIWILSSVSPAGYVFRQAGQKAWRVEDAADIKGDSTARSEWMALTAMNLIAIGRNAEAEQLLDQATKEGVQAGMLAGAKACLAASRGHWEEALDEGRASLAGDPGNQAVRETVIRALGETGRGDEALEEARKLVAIRKDADTLFLLARAANTANSSQEEIIALQELVACGRKTGQPLGASLSYLGQALAKNGQRGAAMQAFREAMTCPELSPEERKTIREMTDHIALERKP